MLPPFSSQLPFRGSLWVWLSLPAPPSLVPCGFGHHCPPPSLAGLVTVAGTPPLDPYAFGHRCDSTFLGSLLVWSPLLAPLSCFPVGLVTVARLLSLGSLWRWSTLLVPHPLFPMGLVTVTSPPSLGSPRAWSTLSSPLPSPRVLLSVYGLERIVASIPKNKTLWH